MQAYSETVRICVKCREPLPPGTADTVCVPCRTNPGQAVPPTAGGSAPPAPPSPADLAPYFPQLEILEPIGQGGMGTVYKARQPQLNRLVALKLLPPHLGADPEFANRFSREAQSLARLNHSHIVSVFDFGQAGGYYYIIMEYVDGPSLRSLMQDGGLRPEEARRIMAEIVQALQYAHEEGLVHRDIKPSNILIDKKGRVKIADFGLVKLAGADGPGGAEPLTTLAMGTPHYMAPEQIETPSLVDHRADLYSAGVVYYEMLTNELPLGRFDPPSRKTAGVDGRVDAVILRALEKDRVRRFQHASEISAALDTTVALPAPSAPAEPAPRPRWSLLGQAALMTGAALLAVVVYGAIHDRATPKHPPGPPPVEVDFAAAAEGPLVGKKIIGELDLSKQQTADVNKTIRRYEREFATLEQKHTARSRDAAGHVHLVTSPFPEEMQQLRDRLWTDLGTVLTPAQLEKAHGLDFSRFFPHDGNQTIRVEIWRGANGEEHYVESEDPGPNAPAKPLPQGPRPMPQRYRFFLPKDN